MCTELSLTALDVFKRKDESLEYMRRRLDLAETSIKAGLEVLLMRAQYFRDVTEQGMEEARKTHFHV